MAVSDMEILNDAFLYIFQHTHHEGGTVGYESRTLGSREKEKHHLNDILKGLMQS